MYEELIEAIKDDKNFLQHKDSLNCDHKYEIDGRYTASNGTKMVKWGCKFCPASYERPEM